MSLSICWIGQFTRLPRSSQRDHALHVPPVSARTNPCYLFAMTVTASPVPILKDNYAWLLRESSTGATAIVDPADAEPIIEAIEKAGGRLDLILLTHHHADHIAGVDEVRARFNCPVVGAAADQHRLPKLDEAVRGGRHRPAGQRHGRGDRHARPYPRADQLLLPGRRDSAVRRHAVQPGVRPPDRRHAGGNVRQSAQAGGATARTRWSAAATNIPRAMLGLLLRSIRTIRRCMTSSRRWSSCAAPVNPACRLSWRTN